YTLLAALLLFPWIGSFFRGGTGWTLIDPLVRWIAECCSAATGPNPFYVLMLVTNPGIRQFFGSTGPLVQPALLTYAGIATICLGWSIFKLRRVFVKAQGQAALRRWWQPVRRRWKIGKHPMLWKEVFLESATAKAGILRRI